MTQTYVLVVQFHLRQLLEEEEEEEKQYRNIVSSISILEHKIIIQWKRTLRMYVLMMESKQDTHTHSRIPGINTLHQTHHRTVSNVVLLLFLINVLWRRTWNAFLRTHFIWFQWQTATIFAILHIHNIFHSLTYSTIFVVLFTLYAGYNVLFLPLFLLSYKSISLIVISHLNKKEKHEENASQMLFIECREC